MEIDIILPPTRFLIIPQPLFSGSQVGTVIMTAVSGFLASSSMGWPSIFYFSGMAGTIWSILYFVYGSNSPAECKAISDDERDYIERSLKQKKDDVSGEGRRMVKFTEF